MMITPEYPKHAYTAAKSWTTDNKKPVFAVAVDMSEKIVYRCKNCADLGIVMMKMASGGPFHTPPPQLSKPVTWFDGEGHGRGWYVIGQTMAFVCPRCGGKK